MALKNCGECNEIITENALRCPHCGSGLSQDLETLLRQMAAKSASAVEEKRRHRRLEFRTMVQVDGEKALLLNLSRSGLLLSTPFYPKGPGVRVILDNGEQHFELEGTIRWVNPKRTFSNLIDFGVEIHDAAPDYCLFVEKLQRLP